MRQPRWLGPVAALTIAACGGSQPASTPAPSSENTPASGSASASAPGAPSVQQGFEQMMQGLQQMADGKGNANVKLVDYELLKGLVPALSGWERSEPKGQQVSMGISVSSAEARYTKGDASMKLEIVDTSFSQLVLAPVMMFARAGYEERSDDGYKKGMTLAGFPGFESWEKGNRDAEVHLIVGDRFIVNVEANGVDGPEPARALAQAVDLKKLAGLK